MTASKDENILETQKTGKLFFNKELNTKRQHFLSISSQNACTCQPGPGTKIFCLSKKNWFWRSKPVTKSVRRKGTEMKRRRAARAPLPSLAPQLPTL